MKTSHVAGWASESPTPAQLKEFFSQIENGRVTKTRLQAFLRDPDLPATNVFPVTVDYDQTVEQMVASGKYDSSNSDITSRHFPSDKKGKVDVNIELVDFNRTMESEEVLKELDKQGLRPATLPELLALGEQHPELQRQFPIIALGSAWRGLRGNRYVAYLDRDGSERVLHLLWLEIRWDAYCRFAAVRK